MNILATFISDETNTILIDTNLISEPYKSQIENEILLHPIHHANISVHKTIFQSIQSSILPSATYPIMVEGALDVYMEN